MFYLVQKVCVSCFLCCTVSCFILCKRFGSVVSCVVLSHVLSCVKGLGQLFLVLYCLMFSLCGGLFNFSVRLLISKLEVNVKTPPF